jgi:hypothetical protein
MSAFSIGAAERRKRFVVTDTFGEEGTLLAGKSSAADSRRAAAADHQVCGGKKEDCSCADHQPEAFIGV